MNVTSCTKQRRGFPQTLPVSVLSLSASLAYRYSAKLDTQRRVHLNAFSGTGQLLKWFALYCVWNIRSGILLQGRSNWTRDFSCSLPRDVSLQLNNGAIKQRSHVRKFTCQATCQLVRYFDLLDRFRK